MSDSEGSLESISSIKRKKSSKLLKEAQNYRNEIEKRGVIYFARIPPHMKPNKMKIIFEDFGKVTRLYLAEEDSETRRKRKEAGGNGSKMFKEGWLEFSDKKIAKQVAESLNNTQIGGKKSSFYHDDIWNIKYLKNFKWDYLTEKLAYERRIREKKLALAMQQEKKANSEFAELVEQQSIRNHINNRKKKRKVSDISNYSEHNEKFESNEENNNNSDSNSNSKKRMFRQRQVLSSQHGEGEAKVFDNHLIENMFGKNKKKKEQ